VKEETHATHDTPNILPTETCDVHTAGNSVIPDFPDFPDFPPTDSQTPTPTPYPDDEDENDEDTIESEFPDIFNYNY